MHRIYCVRDLCGTLAGLLLLAGCGSGPDLHHISGKVTFAGEPVPWGTLMFIPASGIPGPSISAEIVNGQYETVATRTKGVVFGRHMVRLNGYPEKPQSSPDETAAPVRNKPPLFTGYGVEIELTGYTHDFDIPESARGYDMYSSILVKPRPSASRKQ